MQWFISALFGLLAGVVGSLFAPWVHWSIEKRKLRLEYRRKLISDWRQFIDSFNWDEETFGSTSTYAAMRPHMTESSRRFFEAQRTFFVPPDDYRGENMQKRAAVDAVAHIENMWGLV